MWTEIELGRVGVDMTEQEAIKRLEFLNDALNFNRADSDESSCALQMAVEALEKQIAKKPIPKYGMYNTINRYKCPTCDNDYLGGGEYRYPCCEDCGQKLDWSDEDE